MANYIKDDGGRKLAYPHARATTDDCVVRACAIATNTEYRETLKTLAEIGIEVGELPNAKPVYERFLKERGFVKNKPPKKNGKKIPIREWVKTAPLGPIVAITRRHLVSIVDNVIRDTWLDERCVNSYFTKGANS